MNKKLVTSCLLAGSLLLGGCAKKFAENEIYHQWKTKDHRFFLISTPCPDTGYFYENHLDVRGAGFVPNAGIDRVVINYISSSHDNRKFSLQSIEYYNGKDIRRVAEPGNLGDDDRFDREKEYRGDLVNFLYTEESVNAYFSHMKNCKGKYPCKMPESLKNE